MKQPRAWQRMLSGRRLNILDPTPVDIEIEDIAHGLAFVARWNGQTIGNNPFSVAEHSLLVERIFVSQVPSFPAKWRLAALLHDAAEYVIGDMITPVKSEIGPSYTKLEDRLLEVIYLRFGLPMELPVRVSRAIKRADKAAAWLEATQIAGFSETEANKIFGRPTKSLVRDMCITPRAPNEVRDEYLDLASLLMSRMN